MVRLMLFHLVESLAIDTDDGTLRYEGMRVDHVDDVEDARRLVLAGEHKEHLHLAAAEEARAVDDGASAVRVEVDAAAYLLILLRDDEELYGTTHGVYHLVDTEGCDIEHNISVDNLLPVFPSGCFVCLRSPG